MHNVVEQEIWNIKISLNEYRVIATDIIVAMYVEQQKAGGDGVILRENCPTKRQSTAAVISYD